MLPHHIQATKKPAAFSPCSFWRSAGSGVGRRREDRCCKHVWYNQTPESSSFPVLYFIPKPEVVTAFLSTTLSHQRCCACQITHQRWSSFEWCSSGATASSKHNADTTPGNQIGELVPKDLQAVGSGISLHFNTELKSVEMCACE